MDINRIVKSHNREGQPEIFVEVFYDDPKYGKIAHGRWLTPAEYEEFLAEEKKSTATAASVKVMAKHAVAAKALRDEDEEARKKPPVPIEEVKPK